jgi:hypothetical protein
MLLGDADLSGVVDGTDFGIVAANFSKGVTGWVRKTSFTTGWSMGRIWRPSGELQHGASGAGVGGGALSEPALVAFAEANGLMADVPEPASVGVMALGTVGGSTLPRNWIRTTFNSSRIIGKINRVRAAIPLQLWLASDAAPCLPRDSGGSSESCAFNELIKQETS